MADVCLELTCTESVSVAWPRLLGDRGLCAGGSLLDRGPGDRFSIETAAGDLFAGTVGIHVHGADLSLVVENMADARMRLTVEDDDGHGSRIALVLQAAGLHHDEIDSFRTRWRYLLKGLFPWVHLLNEWLCNRWSEG